MKKYLLIIAVLFILLFKNFCFNVGGESNENVSPPQDFIYTRPWIRIVDMEDRLVGNLKVNEKYRLEIFFNENIEEDVQIRVMAVHHDVIDRQKYGLLPIYNLTPEKISDFEKRSADAYQVDHKTLIINTTNLPKKYISYMNTSFRVVDIQIQFRFAGAWELFLFLSQDNHSYLPSINTLTVESENICSYYLFVPIFGVSTLTFGATYLWKKNFYRRALR